MDDETELGRPRRHDRPHSDAAPKGFGMYETESRDCAACGREVTDVPKKLPASAEVYCEPCLEEMTAREEREAVTEREAALYAQRLRIAGFPARWADMTWDKLEPVPEQERALKAAREWAAAGGEFPGLVLYGEVGRGKTAIAAAAAHALMARMPVRWVPVSRMMMDLSGGFGSPPREDAVKRITHPKGVTALVLDDLDKIKPSEHQLSPIYTAINTWLEEGSPLLVTLNRDFASLEQWLGETFGSAIVSRLTECRIVGLNGRDRRDWRVKD